ncbi:putative E3 ubiquitin-protein ligase UBR7 isoform X2 [Brachyhypopomus gauderio]|uniref:putative E3 ubiquitin-protein ligase UBR7 isoform X2 n=1 Tax=Brachyhypopomus gauderio TaxID=698409 RepID=UPI0040416A32
MAASGEDEATVSVVDVLREDEEEATVSLVDVLREDEQLENEASAVLGGSDSERCSYPQGYVKRQALYACSTCTPKGVEPAGVCLACSYKCHEGHELFELYTKRNFRCDCGNNKFGEMECKLFPEKEKMNSGNKYSHNFFGLYCTCDRPYPDPEDEVPDEMIQCVVCEDWLHGRHLGSLVPDCVELHEMICESCMNKFLFLWTYAAHIAVPPTIKVSKSEEEVKVEVEHDDEEDKAGKEDATSPVDDKTEVNGTSSHKRKREEPQEPEASTAEGSGPGCSLDEMKASNKSRAQQGAVFWPAGWRTKLCSCSECEDQFTKAGVAFLFDDTDTVLAYENKGKTSEQAGGAEGRDPLMSALNNLNRVQQLEIIHEYNDMKTELKDYFQRFAAEGKVVTPDDIRRFFEQQQSRKRRRANAGQYYCS